MCQEIEATINKKAYWTKGVYLSVKGGTGASLKTPKD